MEVTKKCEVCGTIFEKGLSPSHVTRKHGITVKDYETQFGRIMFPWTHGHFVKCNVCGKEVYREQNQLNKSTQHKFLCSTCLQNPFVVVPCHVCASEFRIARKYYNLCLRKNIHMHCSDACLKIGRSTLISATKKTQSKDISEKLRKNWQDPILREKRIIGLRAVSHNRKTGKVIICAFCGKEEYKSDCFIRGNKTGKFYCSDDCRDKDRAKTSSFVTCYICNQPMRKWHYQVEANDSKIFAHKACIHKKCEEDSTGYGPEWQETLREFIRERDGRVCKDCGKTEADNYGRRLSVHHKDLHKRNNNSDNLISLCCDCHAKRHPEVRRFLQVGR